MLTLMLLQRHNSNNSNNHTNNMVKSLTDVISNLQQLLCLCWLLLLLLLLLQILCKLRFLFNFPHPYTYILYIKYMQTCIYFACTPYIVIAYFLLNFYLLLLFFFISLLLLHVFSGDFVAHLTHCDVLALTPSFYSTKLTPNVVVAFAVAVVLYYNNVTAKLRSMARLPRQI